MMSLCGDSLLKTIRLRGRLHVLDADLSAWSPRRNACATICLANESPPELTVMSLRKWLILTHRYLGIALSLLFVVWFLSGIGMIYAGGMPRLTPALRLAREPPLDLTRIRLTASEAAAKAGRPSPGRVVLLTIMDRPAYRLSAGRPVTVFADNGELLAAIDEAGVMAIASRFMDLPVGRLAHAGVLRSADQWTIAQRGQMPLHKIAADDAARTELYISARLGEVVVHTTRGSRALAWAAAIPHWLYFAPLRVNDALWRQVVLWTSGLGIVLAIIGLALAIIQFSPSRPLRVGRIGSYIPYAGWMRWHYITGVVFGVFTLTWVFSGLLSMEPWDWVDRGGAGGGLREALTGGPLDLSRFPAIDAAAWDHVVRGHTVKEVEFLRAQDDPYYLVRGSEPAPLLLAANPLGVKRESFSIASIMTRVREGAPNVPIAESAVLTDYDSYYYARDPNPPLPVVRIKFSDPNRTWVYVDPAMSQVVAQFTGRKRVERWVYHGFHSLDFGFWYLKRPLWDIGVIALSLGGAASSAIGLFVGFRRLARRVKRMVF